MRRLVCRLLGHDWDLDPGDFVLACTRCRHTYLDLLAHAQEDPAP